MLRTVERIPAPPGAATLAIDSAGRMWLGEVGGIWLRDTIGMARRRPVPGGIAPTVVGWDSAGAYLRAGDSLFVFARTGDTVAARRGDLGRNPLKQDVRHRALYQGARSGALIAHDPISLQPVWAWASLDRETTSIALSPEGDRLYQALRSESEPYLLARDLQTGRVLGRTELPLPLRQLEAGATGRLYGVAVEGRRTELLALEPLGGEFIERWSTGLPRGEGSDELEIAVSSRRVAVWGLGAEVGLRVFRTDDGSLLGRTSDEPLDAAVAPGTRGELWALYPGELRRLE